MGLSQYLYSTTEKIAADADFHRDQDLEVRLSFWCHYDQLHSWMYNLYLSKGGRDKDFNMANLKLTAADLDAWEAAVNSDYQSVCDDDDPEAGRVDQYRQKDLDAIANARAALQAGNTVLYTGDY